MSIRYICTVYLSICVNQGEQHLRLCFRYGPPLIWRRNDEAGMWSSSEDVKYGQHAAIHSTVLPASDDTYPHKLLEEDLPNAKEHEVM